MAPVTAPPIRDGEVVVAGGRIVDVGPTATVADRHPDAAVRDLGHAVLTAGFVDTHCHVEWSLAPPAGGCRGDFAAWLAAMMARGSTVTADDFAAAARVGVAAAILAGTTFALDAGPTGAGARAAGELGLRAHVHLEAFGRMDPSAANDAAESLALRVRQLDGPLVRGGVSPHAPYTVGPQLWRALADHPELRDRPWMTHLAESDQELAAIAGEPGPLADLFAARGSAPGRWDGAGSVVQRLAAGGALSPGLVAAHCVHVDRADLATLARAGVGIAHCPVSNADLGVGLHDVRAAVDAGVAVGLGSDSPATAGTFDVRAQARATAIRDPHARLRLATIDGARVAGRAGDLGSVEVGKRADLVAVALGAGADDPVGAIFDPSADVVLTMVDGVVVARERRLMTADLAAIRSAGDAVAARFGLSG